MAYLFFAPVAPKRPGTNREYLFVSISWRCIHVFWKQLIGQPRNVKQDQFIPFIASIRRCVESIDASIRSIRTFRRFERFVAAFDSIDSSMLAFVHPIDSSIGSIRRCVESSIRSIRRLVDSSTPSIQWIRRCSHSELHCWVPSHLDIALKIVLSNRR